MEITPLLIWQRLSAIATKTEKSLNQAAEHTGVSSGTISDWKKSFPRLDKLAAIVGFYGASMDSVVFGTERGRDQGSTDQEAVLLSGFRQLDKRDQDDILGNITMKLDAAKRGVISSNLGDV